MRNKINGIVKLGFLSYALITVLGGCKGGTKGQLTGVQGREKWYESTPYGMVYIPAGSYNMGPSDQDVPYAVTAQSKTVTVPAYWMDNTEITNNEYRQFVYWVRDSLAHRLLGGEHLINEGEYDEHINWRLKIKWDDEQNEETLAELFLPETERFYKRKEIDTRKLNFEYYWIDLKSAAQKDLTSAPENSAGSLANRPQGRTDRSVYIKKDILNIYPDTLSWISDYTYAYHEPYTQMYFCHTAYD
jgi:formylglycine-generating enzyme